MGGALVFLSEFYIGNYVTAVPIVTTVPIYIPNTTGTCYLTVNNVALDNTNIIVRFLLYSNCEVTIESLLS